MPQFEIQLDITQLVIPPVCAGMLLIGLTLYLYMYTRYSSSLYLAVTINAFLAFLFVGSETFILSFGSWLKDQYLGRQFHRIEQVSGTLFIFGMPYLITYVLMLNETWHKINRFISYLGLVAAISIVTAAFVSPDLFVSQTIPTTTWNRFEGDYGRGNEGVLYSLRDIILSILMIYTLICLFIDITVYKNIRKLIYPMIGILFAIYGAVVDIIFVHEVKMYDLFPDLYYSRFAVGITMMMIMFMTEITRRFIDTTKEVESAHKTISISEKKYRLLVEGTNDCIFTIDMNYNFINANYAALRQLHIDSQKIHQTNFFDLIYQDPDDLKISLQLAKEKITELVSTKKPVSFKTSLKAFGTKEPKEYSVRCELIEVDDENEIIVKAGSINEDGPMKYIESETAKFTIGNYLIAAEEISKRLVLNLPKFMNTTRVNTIRMGLREIIINAIEHGNLNITFEEKSQATMGENYMEFILSRQKDPKYKDKKVTIEFTLNSNGVVYKINDDGNGFDYSKILGRIRNKQDNEFLAHGRGLTMAMNIFDNIEFNESGNMVLLEKKFT